MQDPKNRQNSTSGHHHTTLSGYILTTKAYIDNRKNLLNSNVCPTSSQYRELWPTSGLHLLASLGHPSTFQRVLRLGNITARHSSSGRQPIFVALNRGRRLYLAAEWNACRISCFPESVAVNTADVLPNTFLLASEE